MRFDSFLFCRSILLALAVMTIGPAAARQLSGIDRLGDAPAAATAAQKRAGTDGSHMHAQFGVPTFVWAQDPAAAGPRKSAREAGGASVVLVDPASAARDHLKQRAPRYGITGSGIDALPVAYSHALKNGGAVVKFRNQIDGVEVFREEAAVLLDSAGELMAIGGFVMGGAPTRAFTAPVPAAIAAALADWSFPEGIAALLQAAGSREGYDYYRLPDGVASNDGSMLESAVRTKPVLFRMPDALLPAYYIEIEIRDGAEPGVIDSYAYVIDAGDRSVLYRRDQTSEAAFTYRVFADSDNLPFPSPAGRAGFPHPDGVPNGYQPPFDTTKLVALQNVPFSKNDPWLPANAVVTTGNNVDAFANLSAPDGFTNGTTDVRASTTSPATFDRAYDPALQPGANGTQVMASVTGLFYINNFLHDWYYDAGFDEAAGNAQTSNFGRGGAGNDAIIAEAQDFSGRSNANMSTPADGGRPRMRMYIFSAAQALQVTVNSPAGIAGLKASAGAAFGPAAFSVTGSVARALPVDGCAVIGGAVAGKIALIDRGSCTFKTKVLNAQIAGATAVVIANNVAGAPLSMGEDATIATAITIPVVMVTQSDGAAIRGQVPVPGVTMTLVSTAGVDRDGSLDNTIVAHEWGHYISNRLVGNANGLTTNAADGMGEGWSDFHALLFLAKGADAQIAGNANFNGVYTIGAYALGGANPNNNSYYYGIRRYPYSRDMTKNPLTFKHVSNGIALPAAPAPSFGSNGASNAEVHSTGEVWASMLWECYGNLLDDTARLTFAEAQDRMKRYLVTGYKMTPVAPTFLEARDALLAAMAAQDSKDYAACYRGFAKRGAGVGAITPDRYSASNSGVTESFVVGGALSIVSATISDAAAGCDVDGILDNGETGTLSIVVKNTGSSALSATTGSVSSSNAHLTFPGGAALSLPPTVPGQQVTVTLPVRVAGAAGVEPATITVTADDPALAIPRPVTAPVAFVVNADGKANQSATDTVETTHTAWTTGNSIADPASDKTWHRTTITQSDHRWLGPDASISQLTWLQSPPLNVAATGNFSFTFRHRFSFEADSIDAYDGGQVQISQDSGATWTDIGASATPGYNGAFAAYTGNTNPYSGLEGYVRQSAAWPALESVTVNLGAAYAGKTVLVRFVIASDEGGDGPGWEIDDIAFANITNTPFDALVAHAGSCAFDVSIVAGTPQAALPLTPFAAPLKVAVKTTAGAPAAGVTVTFAAPASGASATFAGPTSVVTDANGIATAPALTANAIAGSYLVSATAGAQSAAFALTNGATIAAPNLDADGNGQYEALADGMLAVRYLFGITKTPLTTGALGANALRTSPAAIIQYFDAIRPLLDVDGNGKSDALTDGILILRYLYGMRGAPLIANVVGPGATRTTAVLIEAQIRLLLQ